VKCCTSVKEDPFGVGTTWGQQKSSHVVQDEFNIGNQVAELVIYYASQTGLKSLGVPMIKKEQVVLPSAFGKFATPPKNWNSK